MSTTNAFGITPAPVIPVASPSAGSAAGFSNLLAQQNQQVKPVVQTNPILDAVAGPRCNIEWVDNFDQILNYPTSPNEEMYFQDKNEPIIYRRETDGNGNIKNPIHVLRYTVEEMPFGPEAQFVTKDQHQQLYSLVEGLAKTVDGMNDKLEQLLHG